MIIKKEKDDIEFMRGSVAAEFEIIPSSAHLVLILRVFVLTAIIWASFATLDEIAHAEERLFSTQVKLFKTSKEEYSQV